MNPFSLAIMPACGNFSYVIFFISRLFHHQQVTEKENKPMLLQLPGTNNKILLKLLMILPTPTDQFNDASLKRG